MSLLALPNELLLLIAEKMLSRREINAMTQLNQFFHALLNKTLYVRNIRESGGSALTWAAKTGQLTTAQYLIKGGVDVETTSSSRPKGPLHVAASHGHLEVAQLLVNHGANINRLDGDKKTPLHHAARNGHAAVVKMLLRHGANLAQVTNHLMRESPLHLAAQNGHAEVVRLLLEAGCNPNSTTFRARETALHLSLHRGFYGPRAGNRNTISAKKEDAKKAKTALLLIDHGADVHARQNLNQTPLEQAIRLQYVNVVQRLLEKGASPYEPTEWQAPADAHYSGIHPDPFSAHLSLRLMSMLALAEHIGNQEIIRLLHETATKPPTATRGTPDNTMENSRFELPHNATNASGTAGGHHAIAILSCVMNSLETTMTLTWTKVDDPSSLDLW